MNIVILGGTGMLGDAVMHAFQDFRGRVFVSSRKGQIAGLSDSFTNIPFDAECDNLDSHFSVLASGDFIINCIGIIKTEIDEQDELSRARAKEINTAFPKRLAQFAESRDLKVIQIATDCVFSGKKGGYSETDPHDPADFYGITKSAGEVWSDSMMHLRVSIIGREKRNFTSLYEWVARQNEKEHIMGFTNHHWNGIPAFHFGKLARAIVDHGLFSAGVHHVLPADSVTKAQLVRLIAIHSGRTDLIVQDGDAPHAIDRTLTTINKDFNLQLWHAAGYAKLPTIAELVREIL